MSSYEYKGLDYIYPTVHLLADNGIGQSEYAARQCYNSFDKSENDEVKILRDFVLKEETHHIHAQVPMLQNVINSELLKSLSFVHFHESTLEHSVLTFLLTDFGRGVLQELARHRIASYSVQSTRYTMASLINAFTAAVYTEDVFLIKRDIFIKELLKYDLFITAEEEYNILEIGGIFDKLHYHFKKIGLNKWISMTVAKETREKMEAGEFTEFSYQEVLTELNKIDRRNVGDPFKHIITDNFKVSAVMTINLRSYKNFLQLRDSGAAWFQIEELAKEMKRVTPQKYLDLIIKPKKVEKSLEEQLEEAKKKLADIENKIKNQG